MKISANIKNVKGYDKILKNIIGSDGIDEIKGHLNQILIACLLSRSRKIEVLEFEKAVNNRPYDVTIKYNNKIFQVEVKTINKNELDKILSKSPYVATYDGKKTIEQTKEECMWTRRLAGHPDNPGRLNIYWKLKSLLKKTIKQMSLKDGNIIFFVTDARRVQSSYINNLLTHLNKVNEVEEFESFRSWERNGETIYTCIICNTSIHNANEEYLLKHYEKCRKSLSEKELKDIIEKTNAQWRLGIEPNLIEKFKKCEKIYVLYALFGSVERKNFVWDDNINKRTNKYLLNYLRNRRYVSFREDINFKKFWELVEEYKNYKNEIKTFDVLTSAIDKLQIC